MADVPVIISKSIRLREGAAPSNPVNIGTPQEPLNPDGSVTGPDLNKVSYNIADNKTATEKNQARVNIGSTSSTPQIIATAGAIDDLAITSNHLVFSGASVVLSGIVAGLDGEEVTILNVNATALSVLNQSTLSSVANRIIGSVSIPQFSTLRIKYRTTTNRWTLENVGLNDSRYLRKDIADSRVETLTQTGSIIHNITGTNRYELRRGTGGGSSNEVWSFYEDALSTTVPRINITNFGAIINNSTNPCVFATSIRQSVRSQDFDRLVRRDELYLNYQQNVTNAGIINNLILASSTKLLRVSSADEITGLQTDITTAGRLIRIYNITGTGLIIRDNSGSSVAGNRFAIGADFTIPNGQVKSFIYIDSRWREII
jgi:hypothetical protein